MPGPLNQPISDISLVPGKTLSALLAELRINSELSRFIVAVDPSTFGRMIVAYSAGLAGADAPYESATPEAITLAYLLGTQDSGRTLRSLT